MSDKHTVILQDRVGGGISMQVFLVGLEYIFHVYEELTQ